MYFIPVFSYFKLFEFTFIVSNKKKNSFLVLKFSSLNNSLLFFINSVFCIIKSFVLIIFLEYNDLKYILINSSLSSASSSPLVSNLKNLLAKQTYIVLPMLYSNNIL